jgi:hypothetical protein
VQSGTSVKEQGSHDLALDCGTQKMRLKAYVHWDQKDLNPTIIHICSIRLSLSICLCFLSSSSIIYSNWAQTGMLLGFWRTPLEIRGKEWFSVKISYFLKCLRVIHTIHCVQKSNRAELLTLICYRNTEVKKGPMLMAKPGYLHCTQCWCRKTSTTRTKWVHDGYAENKMYGVHSKSKKLGRLL